MGDRSVGKKLDRDVTQRTWKAAWYLLLLSYYSIGLSLHPAIAGEMPTPPRSIELAPVGRKSTPLTYTIVQDGSTGTPQIDIVAPNGTIELNAQQQEFDNNTQVITANGKVVLRFNKALLKADRLRVNLKTKIAIAQGNVSLLRGQQTLYGEQFEYNFEDDSGKISEAGGNVYQPTLVRDLNVLSPQQINAPANVTEKTFTEPLLSDRLRADQPITNIRNTSSTGFTTSDRDIEYQPTLKPSGKLTRLRFQADKVDFVSDRVTAEKIRITNDPFSPPELQIKAERAQFRTINGVESEITLNNPRVLIENNLDIPIPKNRFVFNQIGKESNDSNPFNNIGFDGADRGGVYLQNSFYPIFDPRFQLTITPQYFIQRAVTGLKFFDPSVLGVTTSLVGNLSPDTTVQASAALTGFDLNNFSKNFRGQVGVRQNLSLFGYPHLLAGDAIYRQQVYNSTLGYQDVQSSIGGVLSSSIIPVGNTGVNFDYQVGAQLISANTDRPNLLGANTSPSLVTLSRYQTAANFTKSFRLWEGQSLPVNNKETYNYSPIPVVPYLQLNTGIKGGYNSYSNGDNQSFLGYNVGIQGQFGNFSKSSFDYTGFNLNYYQQYPGSTSPFLFDRIVDNRILSAGINQQISGPFRLGVQSSFNLDSTQQISTDYYVEYSRRTYNIVVRYNPVLGLGSIGFRLNDFNWDGVAPKF
jgi:lipopolysaccharide export system protein LptA